MRGRLQLAVLIFSATIGVAAQAQSSPVLAGFVAADSSGLPAAPWKLELLPEQRIAQTGFRVQDSDGRSALRIEANASYGNLLQRIDRSPGKGQLSWQWRLEAVNALADLRRKEADDTSVKVCALFDLPLERVPFLERQLLRLARASSGSDLPAATVCYVWDDKLPVGTRIDNAYSRRVRYLVLRSGLPAKTQWFNERRDIGADFLALFGDESAGEVPRLKAIAVGADADNTGGRSVAFIADLKLQP